MGSVDLDFKPSVPVLDANVSLGRRHDRPVAVDTVEGVRSEMDRAGIGQALVYAPHAATYDSVEGNSMLMDAVRGRGDFVPQFVCNPAFDDLDTVAAHVEAEGVTSVRMLPGVHNYPFRDWVVGPWLDWLSDAGLPLWLPVEHEVLGTAHEIEPRDVYETLSARPDVRAVLCEAKYHDASWALPLVRSPAQPGLRAVPVRGDGRDHYGRRRHRPRARAVRVALPGRRDVAAAVQPSPLRAEHGRADGDMRGQRRAPAGGELT